MPAFTPFKAATKADTPSFVNAAYYQAKIDEEEARQERISRDQMFGGAIDTYGYVTGEDTPIRDKIRGMFGMEEGAEAALTSALPGAGELSSSLRAMSGTGGGGAIPLAMNPALTGGAAGAGAMSAAGSALPLAMNPAITGGSGIASAAGGAGAAGAMGPVGIALALASLLGLF